VPIIGPKPPRERLTITPLRYHRKRGPIFVLATGAAKAQILVKALQEAGDFDSISGPLGFKRDMVAGYTLILRQIMNDSLKNKTQGQCTYHWVMDYPPVIRQ